MAPDADQSRGAPCSLILIPLPRRPPPRPARARPQPNQDQKRDDHRQFDGVSEQRMRMPSFPPSLHRHLHRPLPRLLELAFGVAAVPRPPAAAAAAAHRHFATKIEFVMCLG